MEAPRLCYDCNKQRKGMDSHLCAARECDVFLCAACWNSHKTWHRLMGGSDSDIFLIFYMQEKDQEVLRLLGAQDENS